MSKRLAGRLVIATALAVSGSLATAKQQDTAQQQVTAQQQATAQQPSAAPTGSAEKGKTLFVERACWQCHGLAAQGGGAAGPRLAGRVAPWPTFSRYVRRPTEEMIPYTAKVLPDQDLADIYSWLRSIPPPPPVGTIPQLAPRK